jgi:hypothetical protein
MQRGDRIGHSRLSDQSVALIVKRQARAAGLPPELQSGHSLRAGYATSAARAGIEERKIANVTRHKNLLFCAATSAPPQPSTTSASCCSSAGSGRHESRLSPRDRHGLRTGLTGRPLPRSSAPRRAAARCAG